jgi:general secretion pathway protein D
VIRLAARLIATQDLPDPEVVLELEVLEVSTNRLLEAGVSWPDGVSAGIQGSSGNAGQLTVNELRNFSSSLVRLQFNDPLFSARLRETNADTNLLANPRIRARNRLPASILIGEKVPVITTSTTANVGVSENVTYLDVGLKLEIEPTISLDDEVALKLKLEVSNILDTVTRTSGTVTYGHDEPQSTRW